MELCVSCRNRTSVERCSNKPLKGLIFCGKHVKVRNPRLWKDLNNLDSRAILIQKAWRGWSVRTWLKLAGPGVLNRKICHNDEELVTLDDKKSVSPFDYFAFEEAGKVYWFDVRSLAQNSMTQVEPINPYTREPLTMDVRKRLRHMCIRRQRVKLHNVHDPHVTRSIHEFISTNWIYVCQVIIENGFFDMSPLYFTSLNRSQLFIFISIIQKDLIAWASEHTNKDSRRHRYQFWTRRLLSEYAKGVDAVRLSYLTARVLITMLNDYPEPYSICFIIMSALHRL